MTTLNNAFLFSALSLFAVGTSQAAILTDFSPESFLIEYSDFSTTTQDASGLYVEGQGIGNTFYGYFAPIDITGLDQIYLTVTAHDNPGVYFRIELYGNDLEDIRIYDGVLESFGTGVSTRVLLNFVSETSDFAEVIGLQFLSDGGSGTSMVLTFEELSAVAVPEPTTYALAISAVAFGLIGARRLRRSR